MNSSKPKSDHRVETVYFTSYSIGVELKDGRTISAPLHWFPKLLKASKEERNNWKICGGGFGIHWPNIDEDLSVEGLLQGTPSYEYKATSKSKTKTIRARSRKKDSSTK